MDANKKISANRAKKIEIVANLSEKLAKSKAIVFTNFEKMTHKQLETLKKAIKPMEAEYVVAKNSLVIRALEENKIKLEGENPLEGPTGTLLIYGDVVSPLKQLAKTIKELGLLNVKLGIMENKFLTGEQVLKISTLPAREVLLAQIAAGLKSPISGLHRALNWNLQKLVMTLSAVAKNKPASNAASVKSDDLTSQPVTEPASGSTATSDVKPETILAETAEEKAAEVPTETAKEEKVEEEVKSVASNAIDKGGEN